MNTRKKIQLVLALSLLAVLSGNVFAFSEANVIQLLTKIDAAVEARDADAVGQYLSESVEILIEMPTPQGTVRAELNKSQYLQILAQTWAAIGSHYKYSRHSTEIASNGEVAQASSVVLEEIEMGGQLIQSETLEVTDFAVEDGDLVVIKVVGQMYVQGEPIPKPSI